MGSFFSSDKNQTTSVEPSMSDSSNKDSLVSTSNHPNEQFDVTDDKTPPSKPMSAFLLFSRDFRQILHNENPGLSFSEKSERTATAWKELHPDEKEKYHIIAKTRNLEMLPVISCLFKQTKWLILLFYSENGNEQRMRTKRPSKNNQEIPDHRFGKQ